MSIREERVRTLVRHLTPSLVARSTGIEKARWGTVAHNQKVKVRLEDLDALIEAFPEYELWLWKGEVDPGQGQISPAYAEADLKLVEQEAGSR
ncbi:DNA-binding protein [Metapseudomonas otitidis]|uniref:DNA-binding protein n=1 Tax=Metapseudomonas otitidis TaxID=319939 RepID=UPI001F1037A7|nr:DNA-binding protein [Pseudomonas otitidis]